MRYLILALLFLSCAPPATAASPGGADEVSVTIRALPAQMKYDTDGFIVTPGAKVRLTLVNDDEMAHNLIVTQPADDKGLALAQTAWALGAQGIARHWIPDDPRVIAATKMVGPHQREELRFTAPSAPGSYPFVCTFPGHAMVMNGVMRVKPAGPGLTDGKFRLFLGKWTGIPDFSKLVPLREGLLEGNLIQWKFDDYKNEFGIRFTGKLEVKTEGEYSFRVMANDGARVSIDGNFIMHPDESQRSGDGKVGRCGLKPGPHDFQLEYFQDVGEADLRVSWEGPDFAETWLSKERIGTVTMHLREDNSKGMPLVVGDEPVIYRNFIEGVGARAIAVGYPGGASAAFDAELCNFSLVWRGGFIDAKRHWTDRGAGFQPPLGYDVLKLDRNVPLALLADADTPWPAPPQDLPNGDWPAGYRFKGYTLDPAGYPTFEYSFQGVTVKERLEAVPSRGRGGAALQRVVTFRSDKPPEGLHLRLMTGGRIVGGGDGEYPVEEGISLQAPGAMVRQAAGTPELLVPVSFKDGAARVEVRYLWKH